MVKTLFVPGLVFVVSALVWSSCGKGSDEQQSVDVDSALYIPRTELATLNELKTATGKLLRVYQTPMLDSSLMNVLVIAHGFSSDSMAIDFGEIDPVVALTLEDLDRDSYQELYIVTQSTSAEASGTVYGVCSEMDTAVSMITYEGPNPYLTKEDEPFYGYQGHDQFKFEKGQLTNTFQVLLDAASGPLPKTIAFQLVKTPGAVSLRPVRMKN